MSFLDSTLQPVFQPLLNFSPFWTIFIISLVYALYATLVYKYLTDQDKAKYIRERQKELQKKARELRDKPQELPKINAEMAKLAKEQMLNSSFKPKVLLATMLPALILFAWMAGALAYEPIFPGETYSVTAVFEPGVAGPATLVAPEGNEIIGNATKEIQNNEATWRLTSEQGEHELVVQVDGVEQAKEVLITRELRYAEPVKQFKESSIEAIRINYNELKPAGDFSLFGWEPQWLGWYLILSLVFSITFRKLFKVY